MDGCKTFTNQPRITVSPHSVPTLVWPYISDFLSFITIQYLYSTNNIAVGHETWCEPCGWCYYCIYITRLDLSTLFECASQAVFPLAVLTAKYSTTCQQQTKSTGILGYAASLIHLCVHCAEARRKPAGLHCTAHNTLAATCCCLQLCMSHL